MGKRVLLILFTLSVTGQCGNAFAVDPRPTIVSAKIYVMQGQLTGDLVAENLFSERIIGTVQSGLPAVVELMFKLTEGKNMIVNRGLVVYELGYDVWSDRYSIAEVESTRVFSSFDEMDTAIRRLHGISIGSLDIHRDNAGDKYLKP